MLDVPPEAAEALRLVADATVIRLWRLRTHDDCPVSIEEIWLDAVRFAPILAMKDSEPSLIYPLYERLCGEIVASVEESITIGHAGETDVSELGLALDTPMILIDRLALGFDGRPIEWRRIRGPASDFHCRIDIR